MRTPERVAISSARRGNVQFGRSATGPDRTSFATANAASAVTGAGPGATDVFSALIPPVMKVLRQARTVSSRTPNASAIWPLVQPDRVSKIARARSASPRSRVAQSHQPLPLLFVRRNRLKRTCNHNQTGVIRDLIFGQKVQGLDCVVLALQRGFCSRHRGFAGLLNILFTMTR